MRGVRLPVVRPRLDFGDNSLVGLAGKPVIRCENLIADLNTPAAEVLRRKMVNTSVTIVKNELQIIPLTALDSRKIAVLSIGDSLHTTFHGTLNRYKSLAMFNVPRKFSKALADSIVKAVIPFDIVILGIHGITSNVSDSFGMTRPMHRLIDTIVHKNRTILTLFGTPYALARIADPGRPEAVLVAYQDNYGTEMASAEIIFGGLPAKGKLPVTAASFKYGTGEETEKTRLEFVIPEEIGLPSESLRKVDSIALKGIESRAYPGCQILLAKNGRIFYEKSFGQPRYEDTVKIGPS